MQHIVFPPLKAWKAEQWHNNIMPIYQNAMDSNGPQTPWGVLVEFEKKKYIYIYGIGILLFVLRCQTIWKSLTSGAQENWQVTWFPYLNEELM